jgi:hypothetical protein
MFEGDGECEIVEGDGGSGTSEGDNGKCAQSGDDSRNRGELADELGKLISKSPQNGEFGIEEQFAKGSAGESEG